MLSKSLSINLKMSPLLLFFQILKLGSIPPSFGPAGNCFERTKETGTCPSYFKRLKTAFISLLVYFRLFTIVLAVLKIPVFFFFLLVSLLF